MSDALVAGWLLEFLVRSSLLFLAAAIVCGLLRRSAARRHLLWLAALAACLLLPLVNGLGPRWDYELWPAPPIETQNPSLKTTSATPEPSAAVATSVAPAQIEKVRNPQPKPEQIERNDDGRSSTATPVSWLALAWTAGAALLLFRLLCGAILVRRALRRGAREVAPEIAELGNRIGKELGIRRPARLLSLEGLAVPMTFASLRPVVLLPADARFWDAERLRIVLLHELAHVKRRDCLTRLFGELVRALYWFHPGVWYALKRLRIESEHACDDVVLNHGAPPTAYADSLLDVARRGVPARGLLQAGVSMASGSQMEKRLIMILSKRNNRAPLTRRAAALTVVAALLLTAPIALVVPVAADPPEAKKKPPKIVVDDEPAVKVRAENRPRRKGASSTPTYRPTNSTTGGRYFAEIGESGARGRPVEDPPKSLTKDISVKFEETPFDEAVAKLSEISQTPIWVNWRQLKSEDGEPRSFTPQTPVTMELNNVSGVTVLELLLLSVSDTARHGYIDGVVVVDFHQNVGASPVPMHDGSPRSRKTLELLTRTASVKFDQTPLREMVHEFGKAAGAEVFVNWRKLGHVGITQDTPVSFSMQHVPLRTLLRLALRATGDHLTYRIDDGVIIVSTAISGKGTVHLRRHPSGRTVTIPATPGGASQPVPAKPRQR